MQSKVDDLEYGHVTLVLTVHSKRIVRFELGQTESSGPPKGMIDVPHPSDNV